MIRERPRILRDWVDPEPPSRLGAQPLVALVLHRRDLFLGFQTWWILTPAPGIRSGPRIVEIPAHRGFLEVARQLDDAGVIRSPLGFMLLTIARGSMRSLKAGEYQIPKVPIPWPSSPSSRVVRCSSTTSSFARVRRWWSSPASSRTSGSPGRRISSESRGTGCSSGPSSLQADSVEGYLFPDTYQFVKGHDAGGDPGEDGGTAPRADLARDPGCGARTRPERAPTPHARVDHREGGGGAHRDAADLRGVLEPAQARHAAPGRPNRPVRARQRTDSVSRAKISSQTHPSTRTGATGLPPGPIASPSLSAIHAAANPAAVNYLYFVAAGDDRRHRFSSDARRPQRRGGPLSPRQATAERGRSPERNAALPACRSSLSDLPVVRKSVVVVKASLVLAIDRRPRLIRR